MASDADGGTARLAPVGRAAIALGLVTARSQALIVRESYGLRLWGLPGGRVEPGESVAQAAQREVYEEAGLWTTIQGLVCVRERGDQICFVFAMPASSCALQTRDPDEIIDLAWIGAHDLDGSGCEMDDLSRRVLARWFTGATLLLPLQPWLGRDGREANLFL